MQPIRENLYQPMAQQPSQFYQDYRNQNVPNPSNIGQLFPGFGNFNTSFKPLPSIPYNGYDPKSMFKNYNFINQDDLLHNNLQHILLNEEIKEYSVLIDSKDRNYQVYPDPFQYNVIFDPLPTTREVVNGKIVKYEVPNPVVNCKFENVRYVKLEEAILPFYNKIRTVKEKCTNDDEIICRDVVDIYRPITENLYIVLSIGGRYDRDKYVDNNMFSTNDVLSDSFATIYYDCRVSDTHYRGLTKNGIRIYDQDNLGEITKFDVRFMTPYGVPLIVGHVDKHIRSNFECTCDNPTGDEGAICYRHNLFHPCNPIFQHHLHFKIGVVEPKLNKKTFD